MQNCIEKFGFVPMSQFLSNFAIQPTELAGNLYIKYNQIPVIDDFKFENSYFDFLQKCYVILKKRNEKINNIIRQKAFLEFFKSIGSELSFFIFENCKLICKLQNVNILILGNNINFEKSFTDEKLLYLNSIFIKHNNFKEQINDIKFFNDISKLNRDYNILISINLKSVKLNCIYKLVLYHFDLQKQKKESKFMNSINKKEFNAIYESVNVKIIVKFCFNVCKRIFNCVFDNFNRKILEKKLRFFVNCKKMSV